MTFRGFSLFFSGKKMYKGCKYNHYLDSAAKTQQAKWHKCRQQPGPTAVGAFHQIRPKTAKFEDQPQVEQPNGQVVEEKLRQKLKGCLYQEDISKQCRVSSWLPNRYFEKLISMWWQCGGNINVAPESSPKHLESPESLPPDMAWFSADVKPTEVLNHSWT